MRFARWYANVGEVAIWPNNEHHTDPALGAALQRIFRIDQVILEIGPERNLATWERRCGINHRANTVLNDRCRRGVLNSRLLGRDRPLIRRQTTRPIWRIWIRKWPHRFRNHRSALGWSATLRVQEHRSTTQ
mgnify:CR=1 FL=1